jgi:AraC family transcriptional regulator
MNYISDDNIIKLDVLEQDNNRAVFSTLKEFNQPVKSQGFAVKYVVDGIERYTLNGEEYSVGTGQYLLLNATIEGHVEIESRKAVKGICLNIVPELLSDVVATIHRPDAAFSDRELGQFFSSSHFLEKLYDAKQTHLGQLLRDMDLSIQNNNLNTEDLTIEFFYTLSEKIIADQIPIFRQLQAIPSIKSTTKKDLYRRIAKGKEFIDASFSTPLTIESVAKEACMSEYHFFRLFKSIFGVSPHQYILKKRLEYGKNILRQDKYCVSDAAFEAGFSDIYTFSKAFKKHFGYAPSSLLK